MSLAQHAMKVQEKTGSLVSDIMSGKYDKEIGGDSKVAKPAPIKPSARLKCRHCGYNLGFNIEIGYHTDYQHEVLLKHQQREDLIYDMAKNPSGVTFKVIDEWFRDAGTPYSLATLHDVLRKMVKLKVLKEEITKQIDISGHNRKTLLYHAVPKKVK